MPASQPSLFLVPIYARVVHLMNRIGRAIDRGFCRIVHTPPFQNRLIRHRLLEEDRAQLADILQLDPADLPPMGGAAASPDFLLVLARCVMANRPEVVVEFGSGTSTFVLARCLKLNGTGCLVSYDHSASFAQITRRQLAAHRLFPAIKVVPLRAPETHKGVGRWYDVDDLPRHIDMLVVDGPPAAFHPETRSGAGAQTFARLRDGGLVFLDDAHRDGERRIAARWSEDYPHIEFRTLDTIKGTLVGRKATVQNCQAGHETRSHSKQVNPQGMAAAAA